MGQPISSVRDDFFDNVEGDLWSASAASGSATKAETGGEARFTLPSSTAGTHIAYYRTPTAYDLTALRWYINIDTMVATGVAATAFFDLFLDGNNILRWRQLSNAITARTIVNGVETQQFTATWNAATYSTWEYSTLAQTSCSNRLRTVFRGRHALPSPSLPSSPSPTCISSSARRAATSLALARSVLRT
jgi:hypothetical protein